ncbi:MAG TPA: SBBP repeat-containing protein [Bacteroidota bacterium]|nr:SBBP repeat-containing protein [Bacteroidota bacterium]
MTHFYSFRILSFMVLLAALALVQAAKSDIPVDDLWARLAGGAQYEGFQTVATDVNGNVCVAGIFGSPTITFGGTTLTNTGTGGSSDLFLVKYGPTGNVLWAVSAGGTSDDHVTNVATDASGDIYLTGSFQSASITFGFTTLTNASPGTADFFIAKYAPSGYSLWALSAGGSADDAGTAVSPDANGNVYAAGNFSSSAITFGSTTLTNAGSVGGCDLFLVKFGPTGSVLWATNAGGISNDYAYALGTDASGDVYMTGGFASPSITFGSTTLTKVACTDFYLVKYAPTGSVLWVRGVGGQNNEVGYGIALDPSGNIYVAGYFGSPTVVFGSTTLTNAGSAGWSDVLLVKYNPAGTCLWATSTGGAAEDVATSIGVDGSGNIYISGYYSSSSISFGSTTLINGGNYDMFLAKYGPSGNPVWAKGAPGSAFESSTGTAVDPSGDVYICGTFTSTSMSFGNSTLTNSGSNDGFLAKFPGDPSPVITKVKDVPNDQGGQVYVLWLASAYDVPQLNSVYYYNIYRGVNASAAKALGLFKPEFRQLMMVDGISDTIYWQNVGEVNAEKLAAYSYAAPTLSDSGPQGTAASYFMVRADGYTGHSWDSNPVSGYSVDNLPPGSAPSPAVSIVSGTAVDLHWSKDIADPDLAFYEIHRSTTCGFTPCAGTRIAQTSDTMLVDNSPVQGAVNYYCIVSVDIHGNRSIPSQETVASLATTQQYAVAEKWNMVSIPMTVADYHKSVLYPTASSYAFIYQKNYVIAPVLENGNGYWLKFPSAQSVSMTGYYLTSDTIPVTAGWNMIGSIGTLVPVGTIMSIPWGIITSKFFGYDGTYRTADVIRPGMGYWVKVSEDGKLILSSSSSSNSPAAIRIVPTDEMPPVTPGDEEQGQSTGLPAFYALAQNSPNPFNPSTDIEYSLPERSNVSLKIYSVTGAEISTVLLGMEDAGYKSIRWDASNVSSGVYFYRLVAVSTAHPAKSFTQVRKMVLMK